MEKGVAACTDAAWMCCDDPVGVPEQLLPRGELRVATKRRYPPLQDGHRGGAGGMLQDTYCIITDP